jgi:succinoglycan biosynthesis transport protein ExoP
MGARDVAAVVRRRWSWIVTAVVAGLLAALLTSSLADRTYRATTGVFFSLQYGDSAADLVQGSTYAQDQVASFAALATTPSVLQPVVDDLGLSLSATALARQVQADAPLDTVLVEITVTDGSAEQSARLANAVAASLSDLVEDLVPENAEGEPTVQATTVAPAEVPTRAASPSPALHLAAGLLGGLVVGIGLAWAREVLDNRVRDADVLAQVTSLPVIGSIGAFRGSGGRQVVVAADPYGTPAESFRQLRTNLQFLALPGDPASSDAGVRVVTVTSARPGEGKSTVAANLAAALAETGDRVLLVDADLRRPTVAATLNLEGAAGLTTVLVGQATLADVVQPWGSGRLEVLTAGPLPPNPTELLGSPAMRRLMAELRAGYDHVVVDAAPVLPVADAAVLSRIVDGSIVVADVTTVRRNQLGESLAGLEQVAARVLGIVLNQVQRDDDSYAYQRNEQAGAAAPSAPPTVAGTPAAAFR